MKRKDLKTRKTTKGAKIKPAMAKNPEPETVVAGGSGTVFPIVGIGASAGGLATVPSAPKTDNALKKKFILLRNQTGHDFSQYKPNTVNRHIERRLAVQQIAGLDNNVKCQLQMPAEMEALFRDLLINVTSFFRDAEAFQALEEQTVPRIFAGKPASAVIRVWSPGCSSGEEACSIAILLAERMESMKQSFKVQVFATDIDSRAIDTALYQAKAAGRNRVVRSNDE